tara:strand:+ start:548 stop:919 length:372 start_codon:yes stop_codon:yes gene_type:complete
MSEEQQENIENVENAEGATDEQESRPLTPYEQNWIFYLYAGIPWWESKKIENEEERQFLLQRCYELKMRQDHEAELQRQKENDMEASLKSLTGGISESLDNVNQKAQGDNDRVAEEAAASLHS